MVNIVLLANNSSKYLLLEKSLYKDRHLELF